MRRKLKKFLINISILVFSLFVIFFALELILRATYRFKFKPRGRANLPISKTYQLSENKNLLYELLPDSRAKIEGKDFVINASGFRDKEYRNKKVSHTRIIFVGDSVTYGWRVSLEETYHKKLEGLLNSEGYAVDIMGMGIPGYNTVQEYNLIKERALEFLPDILILQIVPNDFERTVSIKTFQEGKRLTLIPYNDFSIPFVIKRTMFTYFLMQHSYLFKYINLKLFWFKNKRDPDYTPKNVFLLGEEKSFAHLRKIKKLLEKNSIRFAAVIFPFQKKSDIYVYASLHEKIHKQLEEMRMPYVDLYDVLNIDVEADLWIERRHPNARGHELASLALLSFIKPLLERRNN